MVRFLADCEESFFIGTFLAVGALLMVAGVSLVEDKDFWWLRLLIGGVMVGVATWRIISHILHARRPD